MGKWPKLLLPLSLSLVFMHLRFGFRFLPVVPVSLLICMGLDYILKLYVHVDKPDSELVYVSHISLSSGWPSTFGIVFGSLFGPFLYPFKKPSFAKFYIYRTTQLISLSLLIFGLTARIILGGHWPTQALGSTLFGVLISVYIKECWGDIQARHLNENQ
jgi:membrane-associated phospholipid phosphatase